MIASKLLEGFKTPFELNGTQHLMTSSIGIACYPADGQDSDELLRNADSAMYRAKANGGNQYQYFTKNLATESLARLELENDLRRAIDNNEFFICYQAQYDSAQQQLLSAEALIRWQHPSKGTILPITFIPLAEETGLIVPIGEWVLREVCRQNKEWQDQGLAKIRVAVNLATKQVTPLFKCLTPYQFDFIKLIVNKTQAYS